MNSNLILTEGSVLESLAIVVNSETLGPWRHESRKEKSRFYLPLTRTSLLDTSDSHSSQAPGQHNQLNIHLMSGLGSGPEAPGNLGRIHILWTLSAVCPYGLYLCWWHKRISQRWQHLPAFFTSLSSLHLSLIPSLISAPLEPYSFESALCHNTSSASL